MASPPRTPFHEMPAASQKTRQRKYHRRSRGGCANCKKRHVRCDEKRPLCTNCLRSGGECGYADPFVSTVVGPETATPSPRPAHAYPAEPRYQSLLDATPKDIFSGFLVDMPTKSRWLFQTFAGQRVRDRPGIPGPRESFVIHQALSDPGFLHGSLLLSAVQWLWTTGDFDSVKLPLLHHKLEAYRYVGKQIRNPLTATSDSTIAAVATLALMEASLWETNPLSGVAAIVTHLQGIRRIMDLLGKPVRYSDLSLFQRTVKMALSSILYGEIASKNDFNDDYYLPPPISLLFMAIWPITRDGWWQGAGKSAKDQRVSPGGPVSFRGFVAFNGVPVERDQFSVFAKGSRCAFMSCYLYMAMLLEKGATSSFIMNWLIEQFLDDAVRTEKAFIQGSCSQNVWLWTMMFSLSAVASAVPSTKLEDAQIQMWRRAFYAKIRLASRVMCLGDWNAAKESLRRVAWVDGFEGEEELKQAWEEATSARDGNPGAVKSLAMVKTGAAE